MSIMKHLAEFESQLGKQLGKVYQPCTGELLVFQEVEKVLSIFDNGKSVSYTCPDCGKMHKSKFYAR